MANMFIPPRIVLLIVLCCVWCVLGQFQWQRKDAFDEVRKKLDKVTPENCNIKHVSELHLDIDHVSHLPDIKQINVNPTLPNRTALLHLHNMALSRAFYFSFILQRAWDDKEPGLMYYYLSTIADVAANKHINSSAIYFSPNMSYTPSYKGFFNKTMPLFAPRTFRLDDFNDPIHLQRISTLNTFESADLGAFRRDSRSLNYTSDLYRINEWYKAWLPDTTTRQDSKTTYTVKISHANGTNETFVWHGPPGADETPGPVTWIKPYFDCGRSNKWVVGASVPIPDIYPRHTQFRHIEIPMYVGVSVLEMDFDRIDINQCPLGQGNPGPNKFHGTDRCKHSSTECEPLHGYGFRRGGYQCRCNPGFRLPFNVRQAYLGEIIERATSTEYDRLFNCDSVGYRQYMPVNKIKLDQTSRHMFLSQFSPKPQNVTRYMQQKQFSLPYSKPIHLERDNIEEFLRFIRTRVTKDNCDDKKLFKPEDLVLHGDVAYGVDTQFEGEARSALRLANFISAFLQVVDHDEQFAELRLADKPLTEDQMYGEAVSLVMGNFRIWATSILWDRNKFTNRTLFAPHAFKKDVNTRNFWAEDLARFEGTEKDYLKKPWFRHLKSRWATDMDSLEEFILKIKIRANQGGEYSTKYDHYPIRYRGPNLSHGHWSRPYFDCGGVNEWVITYSAPFFGWDSIKHKLEFKGVVSVTSLLDKLDINQCSDGQNLRNAFKESHKCERRSSICIPIQGRGFDAGGYKCDCEQGYEYPFDMPVAYFDGQLMEAEYEKLWLDEPSWFDILKCRIAAAPSIQGSFMVMLTMVLIAVFFTVV